MSRKGTETLSRTVFERLVRDHHAAVYASALRILRHAEPALDVTQDVYLALLEGRIVLSGTDDERVLRWFAVRGSLQVLRERRHRREREESFAMEQPETTFDSSVQTADTASAVERFVARLPDDLRAAVHLRFHEGLTFARIGEALEISEPAAHERVKRALERLKDALSRAGLAAVALDLEQTLQAAPAAPPVPLFVAKKLFALHSSAATASIATAVIGSALLVAAFVFVVPQLLDSRPNEPAPQVASNVPPEPPQQRKPSLQIEAPLVSGARTSVTAGPIQEPGSNVIVLEPVETNGTIIGRVLDDKNLPVQDLVVVASSLERQGKFSRWAARSKTEGDGTFMIRAPVGAAGVTNYAVGFEGRAEVEDRRALDLVRVQSDAQIDVGDVWLAPQPVDQEGFFELTLKLVNPRGEPVPGVSTTLFRAVRSEDGWSNQRFEVNVRSDAFGRAQLEGAHVGGKILVVDARELGFKRVRRELALTSGAHDLTLTLEQGLEIRGRLVDVGGRPVVRPADEAPYGETLQLHAIAPAEPAEWIFAQIGNAGDFRFQGLDDVEHRLEITHGPWSSICLDGVRAGTADVLITLKRRDDPLDRGQHCAEIHARVVDEASHEPVLVDVLNSEAVELGPYCTPQIFDRDEAPALLKQAPRQVAWFGAYPPKSERVHRTALEPGTYALVVRAPGYAPEFAAPITLAAREMQSDLVVSLVRPTRVSGRVLDVDGRPCARAFVFVNGIGPKSKERLEEHDRDVVETDGAPTADWDLVRTNDEGVFVIEGLSPRYDYVCAALHVHRAPVSSARFAGRDPGVLELRFTAKR